MVQGTPGLVKSEDALQRCCAHCVGCTQSTRCGQDTSSCSTEAKSQGLGLVVGAKKKRGTMELGIGLYILSDSPLSPNEKFVYKVECH
jgi:hypothetical protein